VERRTAAMRISFIIGRRRLFFLCLEKGRYIEVRRWLSSSRRSSIWRLRMLKGMERETGSMDIPRVFILFSFPH